MTTIVLADDHNIMRQGLRLLLEDKPGLQVVGEAGDGREALRLVESLRPDMLVLDMIMPDMNGVAVTAEVTKRLPNTAVVILSMHKLEGYVRKALQAGARAYVLKDATGDELVHAISEVVAGRRYLSPALSQRAVDFFVDGGIPATSDPNLALSRRERELLPLIGQGLTARQIAAKLHVSPRTVEFHRNNIMRKLGFRSQKGLIRLCVRTGLLPEDE